MSRAYKCDRCGKLYDLSTEDNGSYGVGNVAKEWGKLAEPFIDYKLDLCPDCCNELDEWMKKGKAKED